MTYFSKALKIAVENGYKDHKETKYLLIVFKKQAEILLDPDFWKCLGKGLGWGESELWENDKNIPHWKLQWLQLIDSLANGESIEEFFKKLIK